MPSHPQSPHLLEVIPLILETAAVLLEELPLLPQTTVWRATWRRVSSLSLSHTLTHTHTHTTHTHKYYMKDTRRVNSYGDSNTILWWSNCSRTDVEPINYKPARLLRGKLFHLQFSTISRTPPPCPSRSLSLHRMAPFQSIDVLVTYMVPGNAIKRQSNWLQLALWKLNWNLNRKVYKH